MTDGRPGFAERYVNLTKTLSRCSKVQQYDRPDEPHASTLAHALLDLEESFRRLIDGQFAALMRADISDEEVCDLLQDITEELRHVLYHINDAAFIQERVR